MGHNDMFVNVCVVCCYVVDLGWLTEYRGSVGSMKVDGMDTILQSTDSLENFLRPCREVIQCIVEDYRHGDLINCWIQ